MKANTKSHAGLWIIAYMLVFSFSQQAALLFAVNQIMKKEHLSFEAATQLVSVSHTPLVLALSALIGLPLLFMIIRWRNLSWSNMVFQKPMRFQRLLILFFLGIGLNFLASVFLYFVQLIPGLAAWFEAYQQSMKGMLPQSDPRQLIILLGIIVPIYEEVLFRGLVFRELATTIPIKWAIVAQALLFGFWHSTFIQGAYAFVLALLLGRLYLRYHSIAAACAVHCGFNTATYLWIFVVNGLLMN